MFKFSPFIRWLVTALFAFFIFFISSRPIDGAPSIPYLDKIAHFVVYAAFSLLIIWSLRATVMRSKLAILFLGAAIATGYGALMEYYQSFVPERSSEYLDIIANAAGAFITVLVCSNFFQVAEKKKVS
jgi:VanZ family protein